MTNCGSNSRKNLCFVDNGATNQCDMFRKYIPFEEHHGVTIADGDTSSSQGTLRVEARENGRKIFATS